VVVAAAQERLGPIPPELMTEAQKEAVAEFTKVRKNGPFGFWWGYLRIPEVLGPFLEIQTYVHSVLETPKSAIGEKLTHFAILLVARQWTPHTHDVGLGERRVTPQRHEQDQKRDTGSLLKQTDTPWMHTAAPVTMTL
jgi:hypothetical protein